MKIFISEDESSSEDPNIYTWSSTYGCYGGYGCLDCSYLPDCEQLRRNVVIHVRHYHTLPYEIVLPNYLNDNTELLI